ncbi:DASH complex subunit Dam1-domain-containing protein [Xylariomycetidae sp. FL0641]|nr:DASH complex subunit Dam1-domain-containing protein [Xylariomycetidae sp. FL0641]
MSANEGHDSARRPRSTSRSRPTTPLRPSSRSSFRESAQKSVVGSEPFPLNAFEPAFAELSDAVADLEANMMHFQLMHESLARFSESFASFLYGLNMNAFCVDFSEGPVAESFRRARQNEEQPAGPPVSTIRSRSTERGEPEGETTFMTTDTTFVENPPTASKPTPKKFGNPTGRQSRVPGPSRGGAQARGRGAAGRGRPSGLARPRVRGLR